MIAGAQTHPLACEVSIQPVCEASCHEDESTDERAISLTVPCCTAQQSVTNAGQQMLTTALTWRSATHLSLSAGSQQPCRASKLWALSASTAYTGSRQQQQQRKMAHLCLLEPTPALLYIYIYIYTVPDPGFWAADRGLHRLP